MSVNLGDKKIPDYARIALMKTDGFTPGEKISV